MYMCSPYRVQGVSVSHDCGICYALCWCASVVAGHLILPCLEKLEVFKYQITLFYIGHGWVLFRARTVHAWALFKTQTIWLALPRASADE